MSGTRARVSPDSLFREGGFLPDLMAPRDLEVVESLEGLDMDERDQYLRASTLFVDGRPVERDDGQKEAVTAFSGGKLMGYLKYEFKGLGDDERLVINYMKSTGSKPVGWHLLVGVLKLAGERGVSRIETDFLSSTGGERFARKLDQSFGVNMSSDRILDVGELLEGMSKKGVSMDSVKFRRK